MTHGPRAYLIDRFRADANALHHRALALSSASESAPVTSPPLPGPDSTTSARMAAACDDVVAMLEAIPDIGDHATMLVSLGALLPLLEHRAQHDASTPAVRAVYVGAATRIREVQELEATGRGSLDSLP